MRKEAHSFIQYAFVSDELEKFIHFFIAIDALFGKKGDVRNTIIAGICNIFHDIDWRRRIDKLYKLRSELVHGGITDISEWKELQKYRRSFKTEPLNDVAYAAMKALSGYLTRSLQYEKPPWKDVLCEFLHKLCQ